MAYDEQLAERVRELLALREGLVERKMFGGIAWMLDGNLACGVIGDELIVRVGPEESERALAEPGTRVFDFTGRPSRGSSSSRRKRSRARVSSPSGSTRAPASPPRCRRSSLAAPRRAATAPPGGATRSSTRSTRARFRTPTATGSAICAA